MEDWTKLSTMLQQLYQLMLHKLLKNSDNMARTITEAP